MIDIIKSEIKGSANFPLSLWEIEAIAIGGIKRKQASDRPLKKESWLKSK